MPENIPYELTNNQEYAIIEINNRFNENINPICALPVGEGKTAITCMVIKKMISQGYKHIILLVKAANLIDPWKIELKKFSIEYDEIYGKDRKYKIFNSKYEIKKDSIFLTSLKTAAIDIEYIIGMEHFDLLIVDEIHSIINSKQYTQTSINISKIKANKILFLTATPIQNYLYDLGLIHLLLNNKELFNLSINIKLKEKFRILETAYNEALKDKIVIQIEEKIKNANYNFKQSSIIKSRILLSIPLYEETKKYIEDNEKYFNINHGNISNQRLEQFLSHPKSIFKNNTTISYSINCAKLDAVKMILNNISKNEKVIIFSRYKDVLYQYSKELLSIGFNSIIYTGEDRNNKKINYFKNQNTYKVLLTTIFKSAEGINLPEANHVIVLEFWWNPQKIFQAIGRIDRRNQRKNIFIYLLCYNIDGEMYNLNQSIFERMDSKSLEAKKVIQLQAELPKIIIFSNELIFKEELKLFLMQFMNPIRQESIPKNSNIKTDHDKILTAEKERTKNEKKNKENKKQSRISNQEKLYEKALNEALYRYYFRDKSFDDIDLSGSNK